MRTLLLFTLLSFGLTGSTKITWDTLAKVTFTEEYQDDVGAYILIPDFSDEIKSLEGKEISISGYVIPLDIENNDYVLSANPFAACFFCGQSGPESVMQLKLKKKHQFNNDDYHTFKGMLKLNAEDIYSLNYILNEATLVKEQ